MDISSGSHVDPDEAVEMSCVDNTNSPVRHWIPPGLANEPLSLTGPGEGRCDGAMMLLDDAFKGDLDDTGRLGCSEAGGDEAGLSLIAAGGGESEGLGTATAAS